MNRLLFPLSVLAVLLLLLFTAMNFFRPAATSERLPEKTQTNAKISGPAPETAAQAPITAPTPTGSTPGPSTRPSAAARPKNSLPQSSHRRHPVSPEERAERLRDEFEHILQLTDPKEQLSALRFLGESFARTAPELALSLVEQIPDRNAQYAFGHSLALSLFDHSPAQAANWAGQLPVDILKRGLLRTIMSKWSADSLDEAVAFSKEMAPEDIAAFADVMAQQLAVKDMQRAYQWAVELTDQTAQEAAYLKMGEVLARQDPYAAGQWAMEFQGTPTAQRITGFAAQQLAHKNIPEALRWAQELPNPELADFALLTVINNWLKQDPAAATRWSSGLQPEALRSKALYRTTQAWAGQAPEQTANWVVTNTTASERKRFLPNVIRIWARKDPPAAAHWTATTFPASNEQQNLLHTIGRQWLLRDPDEAMAWINQSLLSPARREQLLRQRGK